MIAEAQAPNIESQPDERVEPGITRNILLLSFASFFTAVGGGMVIPLRMVFLVAVLQLPLPTAGLIVGVATCAATIARVVSDRLATTTGTQKPLLVSGYLLSNITMPLLALATGWLSALSLIFLDHVGAGLRSSQRGIILGTSMPPVYSGRAYGFYHNVTRLGAVVGPLFAAMILLGTIQDVRAVFAWTIVPGLIAIGMSLFLLPSPMKVQKAIATTGRVGKYTLDKSLASISSLGVRFWMFTGIATLFALGNPADGFLFLRTAGLEQSLVVVPLVYFGYSLVYAALARPLGALGGRWGRLPVLISGYAVFGLVYAGWALATQAWNTWFLFLLYGAYAAATHGIARAFVSDLVPQELRGRAFSWLGILTGLAAIPGNVFAAWLWVAGGATATFWYGAFMALLSLTLMLAWLPWLRRGVSNAPI